MKKTAIAAALGGLLSLPVYGGGIYVGDVKFFAKEVCSREYTSTFSFNSGCLPPTRVANAQNYFFEDMRLPISHDEAKRLDQVVYEMTHNTNDVSAIKDNLLPSLIGRVFVTDTKDPPDSTKPNHVRYIVPQHGGNFQMLPVENELQVKKIKTEVLVNSDLSGVIRTKLGVSATANLNDMVASALKVAGLPSAQISTQLTADISAALSRTSVGTGSYYYVSMTNETLDGLTGNTYLAQHISPQPADRDETSQTNEPSDSSGTKPVPCKLAKVLGISAATQIATGKGLGIITGVAILRTRSGRSEVCSTMEIAAYKQGTTPTAIGNNESACENLAALLEVNAVTKASIPSALAHLNAGYRQESYKILKLGDHASVLAIQWLPLVLTRPEPSECK